jgi:hypothetical protein
VRIKREEEKARKEEEKARRAEKAAKKFGKSATTKETYSNAAEDNNYGSSEAPVYRPKAAQVLPPAATAVNEESAAE